MDIKDEYIFFTYDKNKKKHMHAFFYSIVISNRKFIALNKNEDKREVPSCTSFVRKKCALAKETWTLRRL